MMQGTRTAKKKLRALFTALADRIRRLKLGQRLALIYLLGIFTPLVLANGFVLRNVIREVQEQEQAFLMALVDRLEDGIVREFEPYEQVSEFVYADSAIYRILSGSFPGFTDYLAAFNDYLLPALDKYVSSFPGITRMLIYTENQMINVSAGYMGINDYVRSEPWFQSMDDQDLVSLVHTDADRRLVVEPTIVISVFRNLNNPQLAPAGRLILRIDINPTVLVRHLASDDLAGQIEVVDLSGTVAAATPAVDTPDAPFEFDLPIEGLTVLNGWRIRGRISAATPMVSWISRWTTLLVVSGVSIVVTSLLILLMSRSLTTRLALLSKQMRKVEHEDFSRIPQQPHSGDEIELLITDYNLMAGKIDSLINDGYKLEIERSRLLLSQRQAELNALQSQVNPHFLYNVLESIRMKSHIRGETETAQVIKKLSKSFRRITSWERDLVSIEEEIAFTTEYIDIQKYRFGDRLTLDLNVDPQAMAFEIPKLTVQALVENACVHGLEARPQGGRIDVRIERTCGEVVLVIADDGIGCDPASIRHAMKAEEHDPSHVGIANVWRRLGLHFGERVVMDFDSVPDQGTRVTIRIANEPVDVADG
jgi:two-component system sensor histidine kinase YesM